MEHTSFWMLIGLAFLVIVGTYFISHSPTITISPSWTNCAANLAQFIILIILAFDLHCALHELTKLLRLLQRPELRGTLDMMKNVSKNLD